MNITKATAEYETWLGAQLPLVRRDLALKHARMAEDAFEFFRATYYRWAERWPLENADLAAAPTVLAVGDLHVENFGTWRDREGRLVWGINDFDEAWPLPFTHDLVRLATSALLAIAGNRLGCGKREATEMILAGYRAALQAGGRPVVLEDANPGLRAMAVARLHDPSAFWRKLDAFSPSTTVPGRVRAALRRALPSARIPYRVVHRIAGLGSLGRPRYVALAEWQGGHVAREAKALAASACAWAAGKGRPAPRYRLILERAVRCADPFVAVVGGRWLVRRLAPDCSRIDLASFPDRLDEDVLLRAMGWESANVHLGSRNAATLARAVGRLPRRWLVDAAHHMVHVVREDWKEWRAAS